jgi:rhamnogalacturonan endolyase
MIAFLALLAAATALRADELGATTVPVSLGEDHGAVVLANGEVTLRFDRETAGLVSLVRHGRELLAAGGGYVQIAYTSRKDHPQLRWAYREVRRTPQLVEIAFVNTSAECPFDFATHYILRAGESGFHNYLAWAHDAARVPGVIQLAQYDFALRIAAPLFTVAAADDRRIAPFPDRSLLTPERSVMDSTYLLPEGGYYSKYFFASERDERHPVHGAMGDGIGIWMIMPSQEHLNGGPEHQELTVHQAGASQILLAHAQGAHFGAGILTSDARDGSWRKVSAPWFIYVNEAPGQTQLWQDAKRRAAAAVAAWPYPWLDAAAFQPVRARVSGRSVDGAGAAIAGARVILADHETSPGPLLWQQQWRGYRFSGWTDRDGRFALGAVRDGRYDLYVWQPGAFGYDLHRDLRVAGGQALELGDVIWNRQPGRERLWQIGVPDHSAEEFGFGDDFRRWGLWQTIAEALPHGPTFVVGASGDREWPFEMAVTQDPDGSWRSPAWRIRFDQAAPRSGRVALMLGIAAYEGRRAPQLVVSLNGEELGRIADLEISGAAHRSGAHAGYQERELVFAAERLRQGANTMIIAMPAPERPETRRQVTPEGALLWDCLRLETRP